MNKKFVYQVGNNKKKLYYDAWPTKYQDVHAFVKSCARITSYNLRYLSEHLLYQL
jgi:hypothetical protein